MRRYAGSLNRADQHSLSCWKPASSRISELHRHFYRRLLKNDRRQGGSRFRSPIESTRGTYLPALSSHVGLLLNSLYHLWFAYIGVTELMSKNLWGFYLLFREAGIINTACSSANPWRRACILGSGIRSEGVISACLLQAPQAFAARDCREVTPFRSSTALRVVRLSFGAAANEMRQPLHG